MLGSVIVLGGVVVAGAAAVVVRRAWLLRAETPQRNHEPFDGAIYRVGDAAVAERRSEAPTATVVCMHGFVEDMRYFTRLYDHPSIQLIALTSCGYHVAVRDAAIEEPPWARTPEAPYASIAYDAAVLVQALEHLPKTADVRVHGHSRGGAVVLEAARLRPDLFDDVEVVLEAPVLPQGEPYAKLGPVLLWLYPFVIPLWRKDPFHPRFARAFGKLDDARKRELLAGLPHNPKRISTLMANVHGLVAWMRERDASLFGNVKRGTVLVPEKDRVLDRAAMLASAKRAGAGWTVVEVDGGCSHFVALDRPDVFPPQRASTTTE